MNIKQLAEKYNDYIIKMRRHFHQNPELSWEEYNTTDFIEKELNSMGLKTTRFEGKTGVLAELKGAKPGKTLILRADIDALPVEEHTDLEFKSTNGNVKFLFQAAEETCHGAEYYVKQGVLNGADAIFGMHIWGTLDAPKINIEPGGRMASCDNFRITVKGKACHGSAPHLGVDAIVAAASIVMNLQTYVSRKNNSLNPLVISIGTINGGQKFNIIADKVVMEGTVRTFSRELRSQIENNMKTIIENTAKALDAEANLEYMYYPGPVINDEGLAKIVRNSAVKLYGEAGLAPLEKMTGSEDFAFYMEKIPGVFAFIGARNEKIGASYTNHSDKFTADEESLHRGSALYAQFAYDFLNNK